MSKYYGKYGGMFMPELLMASIEELEQSWKVVSKDEEFLNEFQHLLKTYAGRPTPLTEAKNLSNRINGPRIFLKREDLLHTGAHKINNSLGQCLLAKRLGKTRIIAETGAGQHGVATATACALLNLECCIYMGTVDMERQNLNVAKMRMLGARVVPVEQGSATLKEAINETLRDWSTSYEKTHYCLGSALGPYPYPEMVAFFQRIIGDETKEQILAETGRLPDAIIACVGGGSNSIGIFTPFLEEKNVKLIGVEGGGRGVSLGEHAARFHGGRPGVLHGCYTYLLQNEEGMVAGTHSISAGLDYPAVGPHHSDLYESGRVHYSRASDEEALESMYLLSATEGIIPALESSHAIAYLVKNPKGFSKEEVVIVNLSGRGDKDLPQLMKEGLL